MKSSMADDSLVQRVQQARAQVQQRTQERLRAEAALDSLKEELELFKQKLRTEGIDPSKLPELVAAAEQDVVTQLTALETALNA